MIEAERGLCVELEETLKPTVPLPVPAGPLVTVTMVGSLLVAVHAQVVVLACNAKVLLAPAGSA